MSKKGKVAKVIEIKDYPPDTRILTFTTTEPIDFCGGMWVMADLGITYADGRPAKRAYSIISADDNQVQFQLAVKGLKTNHTSDAIHNLKVGDPFHFSGPYGKLYRLLPTDTNKTSSILVIATDTGVSAALGLLRSSAMEQLQKNNCNARVIWFCPSADYFLPHWLAQKIFPQIEIYSIEEPSTDSQIREQREKTISSKITELLTTKQQPADLIFLSGDGLLIDHAIVEIIGERINWQLKEEQIRKDVFFNNEKSLIAEKRKKENNHQI